MPIYCCQEDHPRNYQIILETALKEFDELPEFTEET